MRHALILRRTILLAVLALSSFGQPSRIVSTSPSITETLFALDLGSRVVGVSTYCRFPSAVLSLPKIGTYSKPDPEKIALLQPDLVILHNSAPNLADRLTALGIRHAAIKIGSLDQVYSMISDIGAATGVADRAARLNDKVKDGLARIRHQNPAGSGPTVLIIVGKNPGLLTNLIATGPKTYLGELLEIAGGRNVLTDTFIAYPRISLETVVRLNPDVILDASMMGEVHASADGLESRLRDPWMSRVELSAVKHSRVFGLVSETLVTPGPRVVEATELIRERIHATEIR